MVGALDSNTRTEVLAECLVPGLRSARPDPLHARRTRDGAALRCRAASRRGRRAARRSSAASRNRVRLRRTRDADVPRPTWWVPCDGTERSRRQLTPGMVRPRRPRGGGHHAARRLLQPAPVPPDERTIAVEQFDNENAGDLWTIDLRRKLGTRLTFDSRRDSDPVWSPRGDRFAWTRSRDGQQAEIAGAACARRGPGRLDAGTSATNWDRSSRTGRPTVNTSPSSA